MLTRRDIRQAFLAAVTREDLEALAKALLARGLRGDARAAALLLGFCCKQADAQDAVDTMASLVGLSEEE